MTIRATVTTFALVMALAACGRSSTTPSAPTTTAATPDSVSAAATSDSTGATTGSASGGSSPTGSAGAASATGTGAASGATAVNPATANDIADQVTMPPLPAGWVRSARRSEDPMAQAAYLDYRAPGSSSISCGVMVARWYGLPSSFADVEPSMAAELKRTPGAKVVRQESAPGPNGPSTRLEITAPARGKNPALHAALRTERPVAPVLLLVLANASQADEPRCRAHALADRIRWRTGR